MPFIGKQPQVGAYSKLDAITASATATYNLALNSGAYYPSSANHLMVSLNGVIQAPQDSFTISGRTIIFDSALTSNDSIDFIMALGDVLDIGTPSDGTVVTAKIQNAAVTTAKIADANITTAKIADANITTGKLASSLDLSGKTVTMPAGAVLQVKHAILTAPMTSTTAATWIDVTNLSISITPKSTSSKFHVSFNLNAMIIADNQRGGVRLVRDSTAIGVATSTGSRTAASVSFAGDGNIYRQKNMSGSALDSPSTTSAVTYKVQFQCENTTEVKINHDDNDSNGSTFFRATSEITVMEIAG